MRPLRINRLEHSLNIPRKIDLSSLTIKKYIVYEKQPISEEAITARLQHLSKTIECGFHSGFPACCIAFYATVWIWADTYGPWAENHRHKQFLAGLWGYIRCPECIEAKRTVVVKGCPDDKHCNHSVECRVE